MLDDGAAKRARFEQICIYVLGAFQDLCDAGLVSGEIGATLLPGAISQYDQLKASGFRPSDREIEMVMAAFARASGTIPPPEVTALIQRYARNELRGLNY